MVPCISASVEAAEAAVGYTSTAERVGTPAARVADAASELEEIFVVQLAGCWAGPVRWAEIDGKAIAHTQRVVGRQLGKDAR